MNHIKEDIFITQPVQWQVVQRQASNSGIFRISGVCKVSASTILARFVLMSGADGRTTDWQGLDFSNKDGKFQGEVLVYAGGWYVLEIRAKEKDVIIAETKVENIGVGEIFITAGQSNSANYGSEKLKAFEGRVVMYGVGNWKPAEDPIPGAGGQGGSPWCPFADMMVRSLHMPVGIVSLSLGGSPVASWMPESDYSPRLNSMSVTERLEYVRKHDDKGEYYPRLRHMLQEFRPNGVRAVLWHQGEADNANKTTEEQYYQGMKTIIEASTKDAGYKVLWFVSQASFVPERYNPPHTISELVRQAQSRLWKEGIALQGPDTDDLIGLKYRSEDELHFNGYGLVTMAHRWFAMIWGQLFAGRGISY